MLELTSEQRKTLDEFIDKKLSNFADYTGITDLATHVIELIDPTPFKLKAHRYSTEANKIINEQIDKYLEKKFIVRSSGRFASPIVLTYRKDGRPRVCMDFRKLNKNTKKSAYPLPLMDTILDALFEANIISTIDLTDAFHHVPIHPDSREYTGFVVPGRGQFEWVRMPFGLTNSPATFQELTVRLKEKFVEHIRINNLPEHYVDQVHAYLDDWIIISITFDEHILLLNIVLDILHKAGLTINREKSYFAKS